MESKCEIESIAQDRNGNVMVKINKIVTHNGTVVSRQPHRVVIGAEDDSELRLSDVASHLQGMGFDMSEADKQWVRDSVASSRIGHEGV